MKWLILLFLISPAISFIGFSQESMSNTFLQHRLDISNPKKMFAINEQTGNYKNLYHYDKKTKDIFIIGCNTTANDTAYRFCYTGKELIYCDIIIWPEPKKRKGVLSKYYVYKGQFIPIKNATSISPDFLSSLLIKSVWLLKKADELLLSKK